MKKKLKLQSKIILLVCSVVAMVLLVTNLLISRSIEGDVQSHIGQQAISIARMVARSPAVVHGLSGRQDAAGIQQYAQECRDITNVEFIVVFDMNGIRKSHPDPEKIGRHVVGGDEADALAGKEYTSTATGTLGDSLRAFTPVYGPDGKQVGAVLVGILMNDVQYAVQQARMILLSATVAGMLVGIGGAILLGRGIRRTLFGLEPEDIAKRLEERSAMLQSVREGIIAIDCQGTITLINDEARRLLKLAGVRGDPIGGHVNAYVPNTRLMAVVHSGQVELDREQDFNGVAVLTNRMPLVVSGKIVGAISTFRDKTEVKRMAEELTGVRDYVDALRAQAHEFMNKLHVILGLVQLKSYDQLASFIRQAACDHQEEVTFVGRHIRDPVLAGFILSKLSLAREKNVVMCLTEDSYLPEPLNESVTHELVTIIGNLIENAFEAVQNMPRREVELSIDYLPELGMLNILVCDTGAGVPPELSGQIFDKGVSSKENNRGLGLYLAKCSLERLQGEISFTASPEGGTIFSISLPYESGGE